MNDQQVIELRPADVPADVAYPCALKRFALVGARKNCLPCPHFGGFLESSRPATPAFEDRFRVICCAPIARSGVKVDL